MRSIAIRQAWRRRPCPRNEPSLAAQAGPFVTSSAYGFMPGIAVMCSIIAGVARPRSFAFCKALNLRESMPSWNCAPTGPAPCGSSRSCWR